MQSEKNNNIASGLRMKANMNKPEINSDNFFRAQKRNYLTTAFLKLLKIVL